jgi:MFS family permease
VADVRPANQAVANDPPGTDPAITAALLLLTTMIAFENMAVATAMPVVAAELGAVESYGLAFSSMMTAMLLGIVLAGPWTDRVGPLPPVFFGQGLFAGGAILCGAAPSFGVLLLGRVVTGLGAGLVVVVEFVVIARSFAQERRPQVFSWLSAAWILPSLIGGPIAGWLATEFNWRWVFWVIVLPAGVASGLLIMRRDALRAPAAHDSATPSIGDVARDRPDGLGGPQTEPGQQRRLQRRTARLGAVVAGSAGVVQLAIHERPEVVSVLGAAAVLGLLGVAAAAPKLLPPGTFRSARGLPSVVLTRALLNGSFLGAFAYLPLMLTQEKGLDPTSAGLVLAAGSLGWSAGSWAQGRSRRSSVDERADLVVWGATLLAVGWALFVALTVGHAPVWSFAVVIVVGGLGMGLGSTTLSGLVLELSPDHEHGRASAALQLADVLGTVIGIAGATAAFGAWHRVGEHRGFVIVWLGLAAFGALGILTASRCATGTSRTREDVPVRSL